MVHVCVYEYFLCYNLVVIMFFSFFRIPESVLLEFEENVDWKDSCDFQGISQVSHSSKHVFLGFEEPDFLGFEEEPDM